MSGHTDPSRRTLRVTPLLIRPMPEARYPFSMGIDTDPFLPKAGGTVRNNSDLFRRRREEGSPESVSPLSLQTATTTGI